MAALESVGEGNAEGFRKYSQQGLATEGKEEEGGQARLTRRPVFNGTENNGPGPRRVSLVSLGSVQGVRTSDQPSPRGL